MFKRFFYLVILFLVFLSCKKPSEPVFDSVYDEQSERFIPFADLNTSAVTGVRAQSATSGGQFANDYGKPVTQKGVCWSLVESPTVEGTSCSQEGSGLSAFTSTLTNMVADTLYYVRAYATNADGTTYGQQLSFRTLDGRAVFSTPVVSGIGARIASLSGSVSGDGGSSILRRGFVWSVNADPTTQDSVRVLGEGVGEMSVELGSLSPDSTYHFRAFAESGTGLHYSPGSSFKTLDGRAVFGQAGVSAVTSTSATVSATISSDGGEPITGRGVCYATTENPTTEDTCVSSGSGTGSYSVTLTGLSAETAYYVRAYAFNAFRITYSEQVAFTTTGIPPTVTTGAVSNITTSGATVAGNVSDQGGSTVSARGVCYATSENPTTSNTCVSSGSGTGTFTANLTGLTSGVRYYVRAYATNTAGTSYGSQIEFTTTGTAPTVTTGAVSNITTTGATVAGNVTAQGSSTVSARGVCYATTQNPTTANTCVISGSGTGTFTAILTGLTSGVPYYARAYATNAAGTSYGSQIEFTTTGTAPTVTTGSVSNITTTGATVAGNVSDQGGSTVSARGVVWSTSQNPTISSNTGITTSGSGTGSFTANLTGLSAGTRYYVRAYATNAAGTSYGSQIEFTTTNFGGSSSGRDTETVVVDVLNPATGRTWMDRNLGASRAATSSTDEQAYGDLYQWGRRADGHQKRNSPTTTTLSNSDTPSHGSFIIAPNSPYDWRSPQNNNLWQGVNGVNNPCPVGYRVPTAAEWETERESWINRNLAYNSVLKLPEAGIRYADGSLGQVGYNHNYWSSSIDGLGALYLRFYSTNAPLNGYQRVRGISLRCIKDVIDANTPTLTTIPISSITTNSAVSGGDVIFDGGASVTARGVVWSTSQNPTISSNKGFTASGTGTGRFTSNLTGLSAGTRYFFRAYANNSAGTSYGNQLEFNTPSSSTSGRDNNTLLLDVFNPVTGRTWMDRNLGATRAATSSTDSQAYGDLYQWGRRADGHQKRNSSTTTTLSNTDTPSHGRFILAPNAPYDWRSPQNNNLWQGVNGVNNPCPVGYRVPTASEWETEVVSWNTRNSSGAYNSKLKLPMGGRRLFTDGSISGIGGYGAYWASDFSGSESWHLNFYSTAAGVTNFRSSSGYSVRCIKN